MTLACWARGSILLHCQGREGRGGKKERRKEEWVGDGSKVVKEREGREGGGGGMILAECCSYSYTVSPVNSPSLVREEGAQD